jgi:fructose-1,6-bisphosphatase I
LVEKRLKELTEIKQIVSEEKEGIIEINSDWKYLVAYDPLDWSSLIDVNLSVWTIFWIYENDFKGSDLIASCYIVYWPRVEVVFADENWVKFFRLIWKKFEEITLNKLNNKGKILSPWAQNYLWPDYHKNIINSFWEEGYKLRYSGWMVPDLHQILLKWWGLFTYPETIESLNWKLRKLFEVFPFAFIFEKLWWQAIDKNWTRILDLWYENLHESVSCYFWSDWEIEEVKKWLKNNII